MLLAPKLSVTAATTAPSRIDWLDAFRGWAVLGVLLVHCGQVVHATGALDHIAATGQYGVQLFFFVSAVTISMTYNAHIAHYGARTQSQLAWLTKRFFRIAPLYYFAALFYPLEQYSIYLLSNHRYGSTTNAVAIIANFLFIHTWVPSANNTVVPGGWSIGVEMFFYALVPLIWMLGSARRRIGLLAASAVVCLLITMLVARILTGSAYVEDDTYLYYWFPTQAPALIVGLIFYIIAPAGKSPAHSLPRIFAALGGFLICSGFTIYCGSGAEVAPILAPVSVAVAFTFLVLSLNETIKPVIVNRFSIFLGSISYSIYIFHFVVLDAMRFFLLGAHLNHNPPLLFLPVFVIALIITGLIALLSKRLIEDPGIAYGHKVSRSIAGLARPTANNPLMT